MRILDKHLNWMLLIQVIGVGLLNGIVYTIKPGLQVYSIPICIILFYLVQANYLKKKSRSMAWLLVNALPFGIFILPFLKNDSRVDI